MFEIGLDCLTGAGRLCMAFTVTLLEAYVQSVRAVLVKTFPHHDQNISFTSALQGHEIEGFESLPVIQVLEAMNSGSE